MLITDLPRLTDQSVLFICQPSHLCSSQASLTRRGRGLFPRSQSKQALAHMGLRKSRQAQGGMFGLRVPTLGLSIALHLKNRRITEDRQHPSDITVISKRTESREI